MNAKANIQAAPTALDKLRGVIAKRDALGRQSNALQEKLAKLIPIEAEVAIAQTNLQQILQVDADRLQAWVNNGAKGSVPAVDTAAREEASRKLADAKARLEAYGQVKGSLTDQYTAIATELREFTPALAAALMDVLGEEALRAVEDMRKTSLAVLESEAAYFAIRQQMQSINNQPANKAGGASVVEQSFGNWLRAIAVTNQLTNEERGQAMQAGRDRSLARLEKLQAGEDPDA